MLWVDVKYANLLSSRLKLYKVTNTDRFQAKFRCPICGDSKKSETKTRGHFYQNKDGVSMKCFNCGASMGIGSFIRQLDRVLYQQYTLEKFADKKVKKSLPKKSFNTSTKSKLYGNKNIADVLKNIKDLEENHPAVVYCRDRKLPNYKLDSIYYVDRVCDLAYAIPKYRNKLNYKESRIVLPFYDRDKNLIGLTMRAIGDNKLRYITVRVEDSDTPMIFGYDTVDLSQQVICVEGPIDSLFLDNAVAAGGSDMIKAMDLLPEDTIYVFDNEPRNREICKLMQKLIRKGKTICIFPDTLIAKDINDMAKMRYKVNDIVRNNAVSGIVAEMRFKDWRKCVI